MFRIWTCLVEFIFSVDIPYTPSAFIIHTRSPLHPFCLHYTHKISLTQLPPSLYAQDTPTHISAFIIHTRHSLHTFCLHYTHKISIIHMISITHTSAIIIHTRYPLHTFCLHYKHKISLTPISAFIIHTRQKEKFLEFLLPAMISAFVLSCLYLYSNWNPYVTDV